ncbi:MAG: class I SAM-dependent methyltransferase [Gammaproteobacteria bacterium]
MSARTLSLTDDIYRYLLEHSSREPAILARLRKVTASLSTANMQIGPEQGQLMQMLVRLIGARRCIEIGTYTGYSSLAVALALPGDGSLIACDISAEWTQIARQFWKEAGVDTRIDLRLQPAAKTLDELLMAGAVSSFDFAFIDADKTGYLAYYERLLDLMRPGGLIAVDNTLWGGEVANAETNDADTNALRAFNDHVHRDERVDLSLVPIGDGLTLLRKRG